MALGFGATDGTGASDEVVTTITPSSVAAYSCWIYITGAGGGNLGRIFDAGADSCYYASASSIIEFTATWTGDNGIWNVTAPSTGEWHHFLLAYNAGATTNNPFVWIDGVSQTVNQTTVPTGTKDAPGAITIGNRNPTSNRAWNGRIAEFALYDGSNVQRVLDSVSALAAGASPAFFPEFSMYLPMIRANIDHFGAAPTVTGALAQPHPKQTYPRRKNFWPAAATVAYEIAADGGTYAITGAAATFDVTRTIAADGGTYSITGAAAGLTVGREVSAGSGSYAITGAAAGLTATRVITADGGAYSITGASVTFDVARTIAAGSGVYTITGADATLTHGTDVDKEIVADGGTYTITGAAAGLLAGRVLEAGSGTYSITGAAAGLLAGRAIQADGGTYAITGADAGLFTTRTLSANGGTYVITGANVSLDFSGEVVTGDGGRLFNLYTRKRRR